MIKWFKEQSPTVRGMLILIIILIIGIIIRWDYISSEAAESFRDRFTKDEPADHFHTAPDPVEKTTE